MFLGEGASMRSMSTLTRADLADAINRKLGFSSDRTIRLRGAAHARLEGDVALDVRPARDVAAPGAGAPAGAAAGIASMRM